MVNKHFTFLTVLTYKTSPLIMSNDRDIKVKDLVARVQDYGSPMLIFLRLLTWEQPFSWAIVFISCSILFVIVHNLSISTFSILGLLTLWLDYYCCLNNIKIPELSEKGKEQFYSVCSKLVTLRTALTATYFRLKTYQQLNPSHYMQWLLGSFTLLLAASWYIDNLLITYLLGTTSLLMVGFYVSQSECI